jgi:hypothetical protein
VIKISTQMQVHHFVTLVRPISTHTYDLWLNSVGAVEPRVNSDSEEVVGGNMELVAKVDEP